MGIAFRLWRWTGLVGLALLPLAAAAADCRPVPAEPARAAAVRDFGRGLLWRIDSPNRAPSFLFGTFHSSDPRITDLPCPVQQAFEGSASFTMEVILNGPGLVSMAQAMFFNDGTTLREVLGDTLYRQTLEAAGVDDAAAAGFRRKKPWAVLMELSTPTENYGLFLDMAMQFRAILRDKPTYGLETMDEQIAVFNGLSLADQVVLLRDALRTRDQQDDAVEELAQAYLARDLDALVAISEKHGSIDPQVQARLMERLLVARNRNMAERMRVRLAEGNAFVAVGALHLPGRQGVLQLLSDAGYRLTRLY